MSRRPANALPRSIALNDKRALKQFAERKEGIEHAGRLARVAGYALSDLHRYAEFKLAAQQAVAERMRLIACSSSIPAGAEEHCLERARQALEAYISQISRDSMAQICHVVETSEPQKRANILDVLFGD